MRLTMMKSKLHRLRVTAADLDYEGSFTLDPDLMEAADLLPNERVEIYNVTGGQRLATYAIPGRRGSREAQANGAAAHHVKVGDIVIIVSYAEMERDEAENHRPIVVLVDEKNEPKPQEEPVSAS
ncbi:MAG: aspartate 1-decarboxylase [Acidobacteriota bacterium]